MQSTRERILNIIKKRDQATVGELSQELGLTTVTVRHHLDVLRSVGLVASPLVRRRKTPGRPQYTYTLTEDASTFFPKKYDHLASLILSEVHSRLSPAEVNQMMECIGERIADQATLPDEDDFETRLIAAVEFLDRQGYLAHWERHEDGENAGEYLLHVANCPYERVARQYHEVCTIDMTLLTRLLGTSPQRIAWADQSDHQCTYAIRPPSGGCTAPGLNDD
ncbi:MAG: ArsR family transcriptional regulator [Chloroflexota bacterium]|nr:ArsR family transcriptional regulator [Chloroflexota bacterium]